MFILISHKSILGVYLKETGQQEVKVSHMGVTYGCDMCPGTTEKAYKKPWKLVNEAW